MTSQTPDSLIVVTVGAESIALTRTELDAARVRARELGLGATSSDAVESLVDSAHLAKITNLPQSWLEEAARQGRVPCVRAGKYVRFQPSRVIAAITNEEKQRVTSTAPSRRR